MMCEAKKGDEFEDSTNWAVDGRAGAGNKDVRVLCGLAKAEERCCKIAFREEDGKILDGYFLSLWEVGVEGGDVATDKGCKADECGTGA